MSTLYFLDTNVFLYASGENAIFRAPCQAIMRAVASGEVSAATDVAALQEILQVGLNRGRLPGALVIVRKLLESSINVLGVEPPDCAAMASILERSSAMGSHDALHIAVMQRHGLTHIITADRHFTAVPGLTALDPRAAADLLQA